MSLRPFVLGPWAFVMLCASACSRTNTHTAIAAAPVAHAPPAPAAPSTLAPAAPAKGGLDGITFGAPGPVVISPPVPPLVIGMMDHTHLAGWSADGMTFGYCQTSGGSGADHCELHPRNGPIETLDDWNSKTKDIDPALSAKLGARVEKAGISGASGPWAFARDLELTWDASEGGTLRVGAQVKGEPPSYAMVLVDTHRIDAADSVAHPELIAVSPDGALLGVIAHTFLGEFSDWFLVKTMPVARIAAQAYEQAGFAHRMVKDDAKSAELFAKAAAADPTYSFAAYHLACAYARLKDARAEASLAEAIARAGSEAEATKKNARLDPDFDGVKNEKWFLALVTP